MFTSLMRTPGARGKPLSVGTLHKVRGVLHAALNGAIRRGLIDRNPAHWVELPPARRPKAVVWTEARVANWLATGERPRVAVWTPEQTAMFLEASRGHDLFGLYLLVALLGLRRGEAAGIRWCDLDLDRGLLMVSHQVHDHNGRTVICPPKTQSSVRTVALPRVAVTVLRRLYEAQRRCSSVGVPTGFVFVKSRGVPFSPGYLTHTFRRLAARSGVPPIRLHDLRHGAASLTLAAGGELKVVQEMLGHDSIVLTADTYTSLLPCLAHQTAEATAALVLQAAHRTTCTIRGRSRRSRSRYGPRKRRVAQP
jgi:integrase